MAMIKCPECGNEISDSAILCPRCGYHIGRKRAVRVLLISLGLMCAFFIILFGWLFSRLYPIVSL